MGRKSRAKAERRARRDQLLPHAGSADAPPAPVRFTAAPSPTAAVGDCPPRRDAEAQAPGETTLDSIERLRRLAAQKTQVVGEIEREIGALLDSGHSWATIGTALGVSRQGARQRYQGRVGRLL